MLEFLDVQSTRPRRPNDWRRAAFAAQVLLGTALLWLWLALIAAAN